VTGAVDAFWSPWQDVALPEPLSPRVLRRSSTAARPSAGIRRRTGPGSESGPPRPRNCVVGPGTLEARGPAAAGPAAETALRHYLDAGRSARDLADGLPWRSDAHLARCLEAFPGLRLLRQPFGETLLCFLCSAAKQVPQIKQMAASMAERHGPPLFPAPRAPPATPRFSTASPPGPSWRQLPEAALRDCKLGFRARHVHQTARFLAAHPGWLEQVETAPYAEARSAFANCPGRRKDRRLRAAVWGRPPRSLSRRRLDHQGDEPALRPGGLEAGPGRALRADPLRPLGRSRPAVSLRLEREEKKRGGSSSRML